MQYFMKLEGQLYKITKRLYLSLYFLDYKRANAPDMTLLELENGIELDESQYTVSGPPKHGKKKSKV